jgi:hypothetical protein
LQLEVDKLLLAGDVAVDEGVEFEGEGVKEDGVFEHAQVGHVVLVLLFGGDGFHQPDHELCVLFSVEVVKKENIFFLVVEFAVNELFWLLNFLDVLQK